MAVTSLSELIEALAQDAAHRVLGTAESEWIDFKGEPYRLETPKGRRDLISDLSSFANHLGGVVLLGVRTEKKEGSQVEVATELRPIPPHLIDIDRIHSIVRAHVHPLLHVEIRRYSQGPKGNELVALIISSQRQFDKPFIVDLVAADDTDLDLQHAAGWPTRHGADTHWTSAARIQQLIASGLRGPLSFNPPMASRDGDEAADHLEMLAAMDGWSHWGRFIVQAMPNDGSGITDFYGDFLQLVRHWDGIRESGFDLALDWGSVEMVGQHLLSADDRRFVAIARSGLVTAAANGSPDFLGWANHERDPSPTRVITNPYVVVEFPTEAVRFVNEAVAPVVAARSWSFRVSGEQLLEPTPLYLRPRPKHWLMFQEERPPLANSFVRHVSSTGDTWRDAFEVVAEIYGTGYGFGRDVIPFAEDQRINLASMAVRP